ncbi:Uncharacterized protein SHERM_06236 [Striga hermonthica]|uniref:Uncharacterized protein n=1 Tax=Striga hermonthica TaxID=68872 RepID=A0A9N7NWG9_STRHE|nr:Uncharacterized protein SHERM_06236 [Striga hermonthica]
MEAPYHSPQPASHGGDSRPSLGFPLGTALLLLVIFSLSGICSCCYHCGKLRRSLSFHATADLEAAAAVVHRPCKPVIPPMNLKQQETQSLPVIMAGDNVPKFIALPCPCEPPRLGKIIDGADLKKPPSREAVGAHHYIVTVSANRRVSPEPVRMYGSLNHTRATNGLVDGLNCFILTHCVLAGKQRPVHAVAACFSRHGFRRLAAFFAVAVNPSSAARYPLLNSSADEETHTTFVREAFDFRVPFVRSVSFLPSVCQLGL